MKRFVEEEVSGYARDFLLSILNERVCRYAGVHEWQMGPNAAVSTSQKKRDPVVMRVPGEDVEERDEIGGRRRITGAGRGEFNESNAVATAIAVAGENLGFTGS